MHRRALPPWLGSQRLETSLPSCGSPKRAQGRATRGCPVKPLGGGGGGLKEGQALTEGSRQAGSFPHSRNSPTPIYAQQVPPTSSTGICSCTHNGLGPRAQLQPA